MTETPHTTPATGTGTRGTVATLPFVGPTTYEDVAFYGVLGAVTALRWVSWPTAALVGAVHVLHQRSRAVRRGERVEQLREGAIEAVEEAL